MFNLIFLLPNTEIYEKALTVCPRAIIEKACWVFNNKKGKKHKNKESKLHLNQHGKRFPWYKEKLNQTAGSFSFEAFKETGKMLCSLFVRQVT